MDTKPCRYLRHQNPARLSFRRWRSTTPPSPSEFKQPLNRQDEGISVLESTVGRLWMPSSSVSIRSLFRRIPKEPRRLCLLALGGYGRRELFPHSDIDLLFLTEDDSGQATYRDAIATLLRMLWDLRMRVGNSTHTLAECGRLYRDNLEFNVSLLDLRYLAGDADLYTACGARWCPTWWRGTAQDLVRNLVELTGQRHAKHGNTIFHSGAQPEGFARLPARLSRLPMAGPH